MSNQKTNAMRILDKKNIAYECIFYQCEQFTDGVEVAKKTGIEPERCFKTLITFSSGKGGKCEYFVFVIPVCKELDLKACAKAAGVKSLEMLHVKDLLTVSGYVRGGCSPVGMKKEYVTFLENSALDFDSIYLSGGRIGVQLKLNPAELLKVSDKLRVAAGITCEEKAADKTV